MKLLGSMMREDLLISEFRKPRQMLSDQEYDGHLSILDDKMAETLGSPEPRDPPHHFFLIICI